MGVSIQVRNIRTALLLLQVRDGHLESHGVSGVVYAALTTLIGIKHLSPDPAWPSSSAKRNSIAPPKFKVDSFVSDEHSELLRLAAQ